MSLRKRLEKTAESSMPNNVVELMKDISMDCSCLDEKMSILKDKLNAIEDDEMYDECKEVIDNLTQVRYSVIDFSEFLDKYNK